MVKKLILLSCCFSFSGLWAPTAAGDGSTATIPATSRSSSSASTSPSARPQASSSSSTPLVSRQNSTSTSTGSPEELDDDQADVSDQSLPIVDPAFLKENLKKAQQFLQAITTQRQEATDLFNGVKEFVTNANLPGADNRRSSDKVDTDFRGVAQGVLQEEKKLAQDKLKNIDDRLNNIGGKSGRLAGIEGLLTSIRPQGVQDLPTLLEAQEKIDNAYNAMLQLQCDIFLCQHEINLVQTLFKSVFDLINQSVEPLDELASAPAARPVATSSSRAG